LKNKPFFYLLLAGIILFLSRCTEVIPPPTLALSSSTINLGDISSKNSAELKLIKSGVGTISYTISSNKTWLVLGKTVGNIILSRDSLVLSTNILANDIIEGENLATLTITPTINGFAGSPVSIDVRGMFKNTAMVTSSNLLNFNILKAPGKISFSLSKIGLENLSFDAMVDKPWIKIDKSSGTVSDKTDIVVDVDPTNLEAGKFEGKITINPKINNLPSAPIVVNIAGVYDDIISGNIEGHILLKNERWGGNINLNGNVVVPVGKTLTILPGSKIIVKKLTSTLGLNISMNGKLIMNGEPGKIIEMKTADNSSNNAWEGIFVNADAEISYAYFRNAVHPVNFENYSIVYNPQKVPDLHHLFFDNDAFGVTAYQSNFDATFYNLSFRNIEYFDFFVVNNKKVTLLECDFNTVKAYIDVVMRANMGNLTLRACNFMAKKLPQSHLEIYTGISNATVNVNNCYSLGIEIGFGSNGNTLIKSNIATSQLKNIGCGFADNY
jgi:Viral BACON domain